MPGRNIDMPQSNMIAIGGIYTNVSRAFQRGIYDGGVRCLKSSTHDDAVVLEIPLGIIRSVRSDFGKQIRKDYESGKIKISRHKFLKHEIREDGIVNTLDSVQKDNLLAVKVKEATKTGYAVARGGEIPSTSRCREVKQGEEESG